MSREHAFLDALKADPFDDATRLVYADWLEDHGGLRKADYLRLECSVAADWRREWNAHHEQVALRVERNRKGEAFLVLEAD